MNGTVKEWVAKAEADYATATREIKASESPNFDAVCFHAQQCVEEADERPVDSPQHRPAKNPRSNGAGSSADPACPEWSWPAQELRFLTRASVDFRYPGESADFEDAAQSLDIATRLRERLRALLGLSI